MDKVLPVTAARDKLADVIDDVRTLGRRVALSRHGHSFVLATSPRDSDCTVQHSSTDPTWSSV